MNEARGRALVAVAIGLLAFEALAFFAGDAPFAALLRAAAGTWGSPYGIGQVLYKATPLVFSAVAFDLAHRAGLFSIGAEGQIAIASLAAGVFAAKLPASTPAPVAVPSVLAIAALAGGGWAAISGLLRAWFGAHEVIATIMQNRIADAVVPFVLATGAGIGGIRTHDAAASARLPRLDVFFHALRGSAASVAIVLAVAVAFGAARWLGRSRIGRELTWIGLGPEVLRAEGLPVPRRIFLAMTLSGAIAGLSASATVVGYKGYFELGMTSGVGFAGVAVALLANGKPLRLIVAAVLVGTLQQAGLVLNATVPKEAMDVLFAVVILASSWAARAPVEAR